jgi:hypothetical protein
MTTMLIEFAGAIYLLTDEFPASVGEEPVLIGPDGSRYQSGDALPEEIASLQIGKSDGALAGTLTARDLACRGSHKVPPGVFLNYESLTAFAGASAAMLRRFCGQPAL